MFHKKFQDESKLYLAQIIDNSRKKEVSTNWYNDLVGCIMVVKVRPEANRVGWPKPVKEIQYEVADCPHTSLLGKAVKDDLAYHGFANADIQLICEYNVPQPKPTKPIISKEDVLNALDIIKFYLNE